MLCELYTTITDTLNPVVGPRPWFIPPLLIIVYERAMLRCNITIKLSAAIVSLLPVVTCESSESVSRVFPFKG